MIASSKRPEPDIDAMKARALEVLESLHTAVQQAKGALQIERVEDLVASASLVQQHAADLSVTMGGLETLFMICYERMPPREVRVNPWPRGINRVVGWPTSVCRLRLRPDGYGSRELKVGDVLEVLDPDAKDHTYVMGAVKVKRLVVLAEDNIKGQLYRAELTRV